MTASALNIASTAPPAAQPGAGASANAAGNGPVAGFEALLGALFPQADPTAALPAAAGKAAGGVPKILEGLTEDGSKDSPSGDAADADSIVIAEAAPSAGDAALALAGGMMVVQTSGIGTPVATTKTAGADAPSAFGRDKANGVPAAPALTHANPNARLEQKAEVAPDAADAATPALEATVAKPPVMTEGPKPAPQARTAAPTAAAPPPTAAAPAPADVQPDLALAAASAQVTSEASVDATPAEASALAAALPTRPEAAAPTNGRPAKAERNKGSTDPMSADIDAKPADAAERPVLAKAVQAAAKGAAKDASVTVDAPEAKPGSTKETQESGDPTVPADTRVAAQAAALSHSTHGVRAGPETVANLAAQVIKKLSDKTSRFDVQLDPHGLGKVDVRIEIGATGRITAGMTFDNPQAAADVKARANELQRALEQAGFDISGGISFDVAQDRGQSQQQNQAWQDQADAGRAFQGRAFRAALETAGDAADAANQGALRLRRGVNSGLDLRI